MKRQDMVDALRRMGWMPVVSKHYWVGLNRGDTLVFRLRQPNPYLYEQDVTPGDADITYGWRSVWESDRVGNSRWSDLCDDEILRFYLKIIMENI